MSCNGKGCFFCANKTKEMGQKTKELGQKIIMPCMKVMQASKNLRLLRQCTSYAIAERVVLRTLLDKIDDAVRPLTTKLGRINETFQEYKAHEEYIKNFAKAKKTIDETQDLKDGILSENIELDIEMVVLPPPGEKMEPGYFEIYYEYEGIFWECEK
jgi:hypothetical protein